MTQSRPSPTRRIQRRIASLLYFRGPLLASALRKRWVVFRHPHVDIRFGPGTYLGPRFSIHAPAGGTFITGEGVEFRRDFRAELGGADSRLSIGSGSVFTYGVVVQCSTTIEIGERCIFAQATMVVDGSHRFRDMNRPMLEQGYDFRSIRIEDDVSVMTKCTVIADIGERSFIGAHAVVSRPIPPRSLAVGVPARVIESFDNGATTDSTGAAQAHSPKSG